LPTTAGRPQPPILLITAGKILKIRTEIKADKGLQLHPKYIDRAEMKKIRPIPRREKPCPWLKYL
jgi:hypothetical protein